MRRVLSDAEILMVRVEWVPVGCFGGRPVLAFIVCLLVCGGCARLMVGGCLLW